MRNDFINELKSIAMESIGVEVTVDPYAGSAVSEELLTLDHLDDTELAMESYTEALFGEVFFNQEMALESAELSFAEITKFNGELAMESIANAVKRGAYGVQIQAKKVLQKIVAIVKSIFMYLTTASGKFKSYNKLFKKYREKLNKTNPAAVTGDKEEKEISIRVWKEGFLEEAHAGLGSTNTLVKDLREVLTKAQSNDIQGTFKAFVGVFDDFNAAHPSNLKTNFDNITTEEQADSAIKDFKDEFKDAMSELKTTFKDSAESEDRKFADAKSYLTGLAGKLEKLTATDHKFYTEYKKLDRAMKKVGGKSHEDEKDQESVRALNKLTPFLNMLRQSYTVQYKLLTSAYQGVLSDMAKVISAGTKIND